MNSLVEKLQGSKSAALLMDHCLSQGDGVRFLAPEECEAVIAEAGGLLVGHPVMDGARRALSIVGPIEADAVMKATALGLTALLAEQAESRKTKRKLSNHVVAISERLMRAEEELSGPLRRRAEDLRRRSNQLEEAATKDALTGVLNRHGLHSAISRAVEEAIETETELSLIMLDVDHFKSVNDTWGHLVGDKVLAILGATLKKGRRRHDVIGRWGGEEFILALPDCAVESAAEIAEVLRRRIEELAVEHDAGVLKFTSSFGVAELVYPEEGVEYEPEGLTQECIARADARLYVAKEGGRNRVVWSDDS